MKKMFLIIPAILIGLAGCDEIVIEKDGEPQCLDDFLKSLGDDRESLEAEAEKRGIASSDLIFELFTQVVDSGEKLIDCTSAELYEQISVDCGGVYSEQETSDEVVESVKTQLLAIETDSVDLVFLIDATGSMSDDIEVVKTQIISMVNVLSGKHAKASAAIFRDHRIDQPWFESNANKLTSNSQELVQFLGEIEATGGADFPESMFEATIQVANEWNWSNETKILVILTDAPPLTGRKSRHTIEEVIATLQDKAIVPLIYLVSLI